MATSTNAHDIPPLAFHHINVHDDSLNDRNKEDEGIESERKDNVSIGATSGTKDISKTVSEIQSKETLNTIDKKNIRKVILSQEFAEVSYCDGRRTRLEMPYPYDSNYVSWMASAVWYYAGMSDPPVSGRKDDSYHNLMAMRNEFIASALVVSKETFHILEIFPKSITEAAFRGVEVDLKLIIFHLTADEIEDEDFLSDYDFPRSAFKQKAPGAYQAVRLETDQIFFQGILTDTTKLGRLLHPMGLVYLNIELFENTLTFFKDFMKNFTALLKLVKFIKADFQIAEEGHGTTFRECVKDIEEELAQSGMQFIELFDKVARVSVESAVTQQLRLVMLQAPACDMIRIRMPLSLKKSFPSIKERKEGSKKETRPFLDLEETLPTDLFAEESIDKSVIWPTYT